MRRRERIADDLGTGVNIVTMVFGNMGNDSATGVAFSRSWSSRTASISSADGWGPLLAGPAPPFGSGGGRSGSPLPGVQSPLTLD